MTGVQTCALPIYMIIIKTDKEIQSMRAGGKIHARILRMVAERAVVGVSTMELDFYAEQLVRDAGAIPAFKGYKPDGQDGPYPATLCTSVNDEIVHGIPTVHRVLVEGDIVSIDLGIQYQGVFLDGAITIAVGTVSEKIKSFMNDTHTALMIGIEQARAGNTTGDIGFAIQNYCGFTYKYGIVRDLVGHGVGKELHEEPQIPNYGKRGKGPMLQEGLVIAIEPMVNLGTYQVRTLSDKWTVITKDGENYFVAYARITNPRMYGHKIQPNQKFKAVTVVSDKTLLNLIFHGD